MTILPLLLGNGTLGPKLYVVVSEPNGVFPQKGHVDCPNLVVRAAKSHIMTKDHMSDWLDSCVFIPGVPSDIHLLLDSWPSFRNLHLIQSRVPPGSSVHVTNIPAHCTGMIQPLDLHFNGPLKAMVRFLQ